MIGTIARLSLRNALLCIAMVLCALPSSLSWAQSTGAGTVAGQVTDPSNAVIADATVILIDATTKSSRDTKTNDAGRYIFTNVFPGSYDVKISKEGFREAVVSQQTVSIGLVTTINVEMKVGAPAEIVEVRATGVALQTTNATVGSSMNFDIAQALPGLSRDVSGLAMLQPATTPVSGTAGVAGSVAGSNADQNMFVLDGGNNSSDMDGTNTVYLSGFAGNPITGGGGAIPNGVVPTPIDSIEEFKVGVAGQGADFNAAAGNQVTMATRRGTNSIHGSASEYYYGTNFAANSWSNGHTPSIDPATGTSRFFTPLPSRHQNRFSASAGGPVLPFNFLGGETYLFGFYQGVRFPNITTVEKATPSPLLRAGIIQVQNDGNSTITLNGTPYAPGAWMPFNLTSNPVIVNGVTYAPCGTTQSCDPRGIGLNPIVNQIWSQWMPAGNDPTPPTSPVNIGDSHNTFGYKSTIGLPQRDNNWVFRLDHDFGKKWRFMSSYRYYKLSYADTSQVDVGGIVNPGTQKGQYSALRTYPSYPGLLTGGLSTTITSHLYNDFHYSYTYNWWAWDGPGAPPQPGLGLGGAVEIGGESVNALIPYNVNTQQSRTRFWDGQDHMFRDDLSLLKGNHLFQFGGLYQRNFNWHDRNDNGQGTMAANVYQVANSAGINWGGFLPPASILTTSGQQDSFKALAAQVLGMVGQPQTLYTRSSPDLNLLPLGTHAQDKSVIPFYQLYWSDTWHMKPAFTLTYGLSYSLEMPPVEEAGKQVMLVDQGGNPIRMDDYFAQRQQAALAGQVYNPILGFALVPNVVGGGRKYPFDPFYKGFSPRVSAAWNPHFSSGILGSVFGNGKTVIRGGYGRVYGRLNGVNLVLVPLLGTGIMQGVACIGAVNAANAVAGNQCLGSGGATPATAFRIGTDGLVAPLGGTPSATLPQPYFPGVGGNLAAAPGAGLDPNTRPSVNDSFTFSIQREVSRKLFVEAGYIGKLIRNEFQEVNVDAIPWMTTLGGQTFANAYANIYTAICGLNVQICGGTNVGTPPPQAFIEAALGGPTSAFCSTFASCTAALIANKNDRNFIASNRVYELWNAMATTTSWTLGRTNPGMNPPGGCPAIVTPTTICRQFQAFEFDGSNGFGNYHALYSSVTFQDWHGITARSNFTWGRSLGTNSEVQARSTRTVLNPWDLRSEYGPNGFDVKFIYNLAVNYTLPFFKSQHGVTGRLLGGWSVSPLFTAQSGFPLNVTQTDGSEAFGQSDPSQSSIYNVVLTNGSFTGGNSLHYSTTSPTGVGTNATSQGQWLNMFADPAAAYSQFRRFILGVDTRGGGFGILRGFPRWNLDMAVTKEVRATERVGISFTTLMTNVLNHFQPSDPSMNINSPATFGRVSAAQYDSRQIEFGIRVHW